MVYEWTLSQEQYEYLKSQDALFLEALAQKNYSKAGNLSQHTLKFFISDVMEFTNLYDFTFNDNSLTNYEYVCYLQQPEVRRAIHTGNATFHYGNMPYEHLKDSIMISKKAWLVEALG